MGARAYIPAGIATPQIGGNALGGVNPFSMMKDVMELRNMQQQWNAQIDTSQRIAASNSYEEARDNILKGPYAALGLQYLNTYSEAHLRDAEARRAGAAADLTRFQNGAEAMTFLSKFGPDDPKQYMDQAHVIAKNLPPDVAGPFMDWALSQTYNVDLTNPQSFVSKRLSQQIAAGIPAESAYAARGGLAPRFEPTIRGPMGEEYSGVVGGFGSLGQTPGQTPGVGTGASFQPSPMVQPVSPTPPATPVQRQQTADLEKTRSDLNTNIQSSNKAMAQINKADELLSRFDTSSLSERRSVLAGYAQALGMDPAQISEIAGGDLSSMQEFNKYIAGIAMQRQMGMMPPGGRMNLPETETWLRNNPTIDMQKGAIQDIFAGWRRMHISDVIQQRALGNFMQEHAHDPDAAVTWARRWQDLQQRKGLNDPHFYIPGTTKAIPETVIMDLMANPTPANREKVDRKYGSGTSARFLEDN